MASNSKQVRVIDPILTTFARGFKAAANICHDLFPVVFVKQTGGKVIEFDDSDFELVDTERAPGSRTKRAEYGHKGAPYALENHALDAVIPREHQRDGGAVPGIDEAQSKLAGVQNTMSLKLEHQAATLARDETRYDANHKLALAGADQWSDYGQSDPIKDIKEGREAIRRSIGMYPNVLALPAGVESILCEHPELLDRIKFSERGVVTAELLAQVFKVPRVVIGGRVFKQAGQMVDVWGNDAILAYVPPATTGMSRDAAEPGYGYTYTMEDHPLVEVPRWDGDTKSWVYGQSHERAPVLAGATAGFLFKNVIAAQ